METKYYNLLVSHGILPMLTAIEKLEGLERYEECSLIIGAINSYAKNTRTKPPMYITEEFIAWVAKENKWSVDHTINQAKYSADTVIKTIDSWKQKN